MSAELSNVIVDGNLLVSKSAIINSTLNATNIYSMNDVQITNGDSLKTIGTYLNIDYLNHITNTKFGRDSLPNEQQVIIIHV